MDYELALKNEVQVNHKTISKLFETSEVFVCGYGSLLYTSGWWGRNMMYQPIKKDLIECRVDGYERGTFGIYSLDKDIVGGIHFYGVIPNSKTHLNGVLVKIRSINDWANLMRTECIAGMTTNYNYRCVDITANVTGVNLKPGQVVHMVVNEPENKHRYRHCSPAPQYYRKVTEGVKKERSLDFQREFFKTGGLTSKQITALYKAAYMNRGRYYR